MHMDSAENKAIAAFAYKTNRTREPVEVTATAASKLHDTRFAFAGERPSGRHHFDMSDKPVLRAR